MENRDSLRICVLGYGVNVSEKNKELAKEAGKYIAEAGFVTVVGNLQGTFFEALNGANSNNGKTSLILSKDITSEPPVYCTDILFVDNEQAKHLQLAKTCWATIIIGGGEGSRDVVNLMIDQGCKIVAISGSGGIADSLLSDKIYRTSSVSDGVNWIKEICYAVDKNNF